MKPDYILQIENTRGYLSELIFPKMKNLSDYWKSKKVSKVFESSLIDTDGKIQPNNIIFETNQGFFIYIQKEEFDDWSMTIYYKPNQENELILFSKGILKQLKNATDYNRGIETKN